MGSKFKILKGLKTNLPSASAATDGNVYYTTDESKFYINYIDSNNKPQQKVLNAGMADKLAAARTIALSGDVSGSATFDGSGNITITTTVADSSHNHAASNITSGTLDAARLPLATTSAFGAIKVGSNLSISSGTLSVPAASGSVAGVTIVYPAASCTTFSSDSGTVTPLAVQKGAKMFSITRPSSSTNKAIVRYSNTTGDVQDSKILIEDVTNTADKSKTAQILSIPAEGGKKMVYGYCTDQVDGTSFIGGVFDANATSFPYSAGLAIGGTSGNLLWKGKKVAITDDIPGYGTAAPAANGTASAGSATTISRSDHVHPLQTTVSGNAGTATKLATARTISLTGDVSGSASFDGSANASITATVADNSHNHNFANLGQGYGTCSTAASTAAKEVTLANYVLQPGGIVVVKFTNSVPANATLNANSQGAKSIYYRGKAIVGGLINAGEFATFIYDGTYYHLINIDRDRFFTTLVPYGTQITASESAPTDLNSTVYLKVGNYFCSANAQAQYISNLPKAKTAFMMQVYSPLSQTVDDETGTWKYRLRKIIFYTGEEYSQYCYTDGTAGNWHYGDWKKVATSADVKVTADQAIHFSITSDGILQVTY